MTGDLQGLKLDQRAEVYKSGHLAGHLVRTEQGGTKFAYDAAYVEAGKPPVAFSLPLSDAEVSASNGAVPPFFAGLLPEGHRLTMLRDATKTSLDDELTLLMAVGADVPGDVQIVPEGAFLVAPRALAEVSVPQELDFEALAHTLDLQGVPGVQSKVSATMLTTPVAISGGSYILKLDPATNPHLVVNEAAHLVGARGLRIPVAQAQVVADRMGRNGLLVTRFDRATNTDSDGSGQAHGSQMRLPLEDGTQVLGLPPAAKYTVDSETVALALAGHCMAPKVALRNLYLQFVYAWLTGNGDLHAKNLSILGNQRSEFAVAPVYDVPCTLLYGDETMALSIAGKVRRIRARHWEEFADSLGIPQRAAAAANQIALRAAATVELEKLPFLGSPLRGTQRELSIRREEFGG